MADQYSTTVRNARADATSTAIGGGGKLRVYTGAAPANCGTAASGTLLSEHTCGTPFAPAASGGVQSPTLPADVNASASGNAGYYRVYDAAGTNCHIQGSIGTSGTDIIVSRIDFAAGSPVHVASWTRTEQGA